MIAELLFRREDQARELEITGADGGAGLSGNSGGR